LCAWDGVDPGPTAGRDEWCAQGVFDVSMFSSFRGRGFDWLRQQLRRRRAADQTRRYIDRAERFNPPWRMVGGEENNSSNPLRDFFANRIKGRSVHKWTHYFDIYHRHLERFRDKPIHLLEIGLDQGGSLDMWRSYFGPKAHYYGVDIEPSCRKYESADTRIFMGDQEDPNFWREFRRGVPDLDVVIDDGGHEPQQQAVSLEELLFHLRPGGVYICEDIHGSRNDFAEFAARLSNRLHTCSMTYTPDHDPTIRTPTDAFQTAVHSMHVYPFVVVIERNRAPTRELISRRRPMNGARL
jgi:hypothetical protein